MRKHKARLTCFWRTSMGESWLVMVSMGTSLPARVWHSTFWLQNKDLNTTKSVKTVQAQNPTEFDLNF